jgi:hypothetical protein
MGWNHRVVYHKAGFVENNPALTWVEYLAIHEVHYDEDDKPMMMTEQPVNILSSGGNEPLVEIKWMLQEMLKATEKPILDFDNLEEIEREKQDDFSKSFKKEEQTDPKD